MCGVKLNMFHTTKLLHNFYTVASWYFWVRYCFTFPDVLMPLTRQRTTTTQEKSRHIAKSHLMGPRCSIPADIFNTCLLDHKQTAVRSSAQAIMMDLVVDSFNNCFLDYKQTAVRTSAQAIMVDLVVGSFNNCFLDHKRTTVRSVSTSPHGGAHSWNRKMLADPNPIPELV